METRWTPSGEFNPEDEKSKTPTNPNKSKVASGCAVWLVILALATALLIWIGNSCDTQTDDRSSARVTPWPTATTIPSTVGQSHDRQTTATRSPVTIEKKQQQSQPVSSQWYEGGTLHSATAAEWVRASERNKLATAADWATSILLEEDRMPRVEKVKPYATALKDCVDATTDPKPIIPKQKVAEMAVACWILMGL